jgi:uncharacterized membrane protein
LRRNEEYGEGNRMKHPRWIKEDVHFNLPKIRLKVDSRMGPILIFESEKIKIGFAFCHRRKDRSFKMFGYTFPLCARCTGLWLGFGMGLFFRILGLHVPSVFAIGFMLPLIIDGFTQLFGLRESNNLLRLLTGILFGIAINMLFQEIKL